MRSLKDLIAAAQNGTFECHSWGSRFPVIDRPDRITLDLDPDPKMQWPAFVDACSLVRALLDKLDLRWFIKTTGGKGLHFVLPLERRYPWDEVKEFSRPGGPSWVVVADAVHCEEYQEPAQGSGVR